MQRIKVVDGVINERKVKVLSGDVGKSGLFRRYGLKRVKLGLFASMLCCSYLPLLLIVDAGWCLDRTNGQFYNANDIHDANRATSVKLRPSNNISSTSIIWTGC
jgi:hypothetical protein